MAKAKSMPRASASMREDHDWEAHDAMHTLMRAGEVIANKPLLKRARVAAQKHATKMQAVAEQAGALAKRGLISEKQMAKMGGKKPASKASPGNQGGKVSDLEKTAAVA